MSRLARVAVVLITGLALARLLRRQANRSGVFVKSSAGRQRFPVSPSANVPEAIRPAAIIGDQPAAELRRNWGGVAVGFMVIAASLFLAYKTQQLTPIAELRPRSAPTVVVFLDPPPTAEQRPIVYATVDVRPGLFGCGHVRTDIEFTFPYDFGLFSGRLVAVATAGPYDVHSISARPLPEIGEQPTEARLVELIHSDPGGRYYYAIGGKVENGHGARRLLVSIDADWAQRRGLGACVLHTPDVIAAVTENAATARTAAGIVINLLGARGNAYRAVEPFRGTVAIVRGVKVDRDLTFPPPDNQYDLKWDCRRGDEMERGCDAVVAVERHDVATLRGPSLLLLGTLVGLGLQVVYDQFRRRPRVWRTSSAGTPIRW